ncbi:hypothetical protein Ccrd_013622 [Cynara cardunculus var. scolymus]|uniref:RING-type E3 ubiquitin transferase n=1 Tax=Cynara cardunculus var. scolymus TaxID=59895 RepID=A0A118K4T4_CYNCS|nr:hypothetical protein Ccrd_013622 [Cynara cardunculus var. scolymus]
MEEGTKSENHLISVAAFVEGGTQDACDDACSICLESFSENDPPTVTGCKHEFHLQCILECVPVSKELSMPNVLAVHQLEGPEQLPVSATDAELEERIIQHLAAAAAMGRARHIARREGHRTQTSVQGRPRYLGFSAQPSVPSPTRPTSSDDVESTPAIGGSPLVTVHEESVRGSAASSSVHASEHPVSPSVMQSSPNNQDRAGPSELHSFSDFKTRVNAISMRYKESITKTTKNWKEKLFSRNSSATDHGSTDPGEGSAGIATLSRMMDHLQHDLAPPISNNSPLTDERRQQNTMATTATNSASRNQTAPPSSTVE